MDGKEESPARGLKSMLSRNRHRKDDSPRDHTDSHSNQGDSSESGPEKFKPRPSIVGSDMIAGNTPMADRSGRKSKPTRKEGGGADGSVPKTPASTGNPGSINGSTKDVEEGSTMTSDSEGERA